MLRPHTWFSTLGVWFFIRVPSPAARMITAAGPLRLTRLPRVAAGTWACGAPWRMSPRAVHVRTLAGYRQVDQPGPAWHHLRTLFCQSIALMFEYDQEGCVP